MNNRFNKIPAKKHPGKDNTDTDTSKQEKKLVPLSMSSFSSTGQGGLRYSAVMTF